MMDNDKVEPTSSESKKRTCNFYVTRKKRFCHSVAARGNEYCGQHLVGREDKSVRYEGDWKQGGKRSQKNKILALVYCLDWKVVF